MANLLEMVLFTNKKRPDFELMPNIASSSDIAMLRSYLTKQALNWDVSWLMWMDADHAFPPDTLLRLLHRNLDFVGCNHRRKVPPHLFTSSRGGQIIETTKERAVETPVEQVDFVSLAMTLVAADAVRKLEEPFFAFQPLADGTFKGEDHFFTEKLREAGVPIHLDHQLSLEVGHIAEQVIYP